VIYRWTHVTRREGVNTPLTSCISGIRDIRAWELDIETCEVVSSKNARRKVNIASRGFVKGRCQGWMPQLVKVRVARGASIKPSRWSHEEGADRGRAIPVSTLWVLQDLKGRGKILDSRTREIVRL
jgi:hypothetical protein